MVDLVFRDDERVRSFPDEPDVVTNTARDGYVLLRTLSVIELRREFAAFDKRIRALIVELLMLKASHVFERYGQLDMSEANNVKRANIEYGFVATDSLPRRFVLLKQTAVLEGLIATGAVGRRTAGGVDRQRLRGAGGVVEETLSRSSDARQAILRTIFAKPDSMDDALQMGSGFQATTGTDPFASRGSDPHAGFLA